MKILDQYGLEIAISSPNERERTSYVMVSRGKSRFVDEIILPKPNSDQVQNYSLKFKKSEARECCLAQSKTSIQETDAARVKSPTSNKGHPQHYSQPSVFVHTKKNYCDQEELESYFCQFFVWRNSVTGGLQNGYRNGAPSRSR